MRVRTRMHTHAHAHARPHTRGRRPGRGAAKNSQSRILPARTQPPLGPGTTPTGHSSGRRIRAEKWPTPDSPGGGRPRSDRGQRRWVYRGRVRPPGDVRGGRALGPGPGRPSPPPRMLPRPHPGLPRPPPRHPARRPHPGLPWPPAQPHRLCSQTPQNPRLPLRVTSPRLASGQAGGTQRAATEDQGLARELKGPSAVLGRDVCGAGTVRGHYP